MTSLETNPWIAFGDKLRQLRKRAGLTGAALAEQAGPGWAPSKISRIQGGQQVISEQDLDTWCRLCRASEAERDDLFADLRAARFESARWKRRASGGHEPVQRSFAEDEQAATVVRNLETGIVPGLLQTPDYARAVFRAFAQLQGSPDDADDAVRERLRRQTILYDSTKRIELLVTEAALRTPIAKPTVMAAQIDRLLAVLGVANVRFGIIPLGVQVDVPPMHGFWILDDVARIEVLTTEVVTRNPTDIRLYNAMLDQLWEHDELAEGDPARQLLLTVSERYQRESSQLT